MIENLTVMLSDKQNDEGVVFPSEEEVMNMNILGPGYE